MIGQRLAQLQIVCNHLAYLNSTLRSTCRQMVALPVLPKLGIKALVFPLPESLHFGIQDPKNT